MTTRTRETTVTFVHPFMIAAFDRPQPAGTYRLVTDEEEIIGLSFLAFQRAATVMHLPAIDVSSIPREVVPVDPDELDRALAADALLP